MSKMTTTGRAERPSYSFQARVVPPVARWPKASMLAIATLAYLGCVALATFPVVARFGSEIPGDLTDPLEHLWILRWSKACLLAGRSPFFCSALQYPTGVPLGYFPTMHLQTAFYLALGLATSNDVACFNVIWTFGLISTGMGTFLLAWWVTRRTLPGWLAGLGAMLSGPMMMHAHGHLETMQVGSVPLFFIAWMRFADRPGPVRLLLAVASYWLVVAGAPYFAVLAIFPAAWYVGWSILVAGRGRRCPWVSGRVAWLAGFSTLALPGLLGLFASQVWASRHGYEMARPRWQFNMFGAPPWSSFVPSPRHLLGRFVLPDLFEATGYASRVSECSSYLGVVTLALLAYAACCRVRFPRASFWWTSLAFMVVLSWGSHLQVGPARISLPAGWLYGVFPPFHLIRVPARFNLFAVVCAAVPASAGLAHLLDRFRASGLKLTITAACGLLMMADLSMAPFPTAMIPPMLPAYREITGRNRDAALVDAPMFGSDEGQTFSSLWGYWQSIHGAKTTAGYPGLTNAAFDAEIVPMSPWWSRRWVDPAYLSVPAEERFGPVIGVDARDYAWLFLTAHGFDHVVIHQGMWIDPKFGAGRPRIKALLDDAMSFEDADVAVYDRDRLQAPSQLTWLCVRGWRLSRASAGSPTFGVLRRARLAVFEPSGSSAVRLEIGGASGFARTRMVRLLEGDRELAHWTIEPSVARNVASPTIRLTPGLHEWTIECDSDDRPSRAADRLDDARTPYSLKVETVQIRRIGRDD